MKNHVEDCTSMNIFKKAMKQYMWLLTRNTAQLGYSGIFEYNVLIFVNNIAERTHYHVLRHVFD